MTLNKVLLAIAFLAPGAMAQQLSISNITYTGTATQGNSSIQLSGTGTATLSPGGSATFTLTGSTLRQKQGLTCASGDLTQLTLKFQTTSDSITLLITVPSPVIDSPTASVTLNANYNVVGGTGAFANNGGSGTLSLPLHVTGGSETSFTYAGSAGTASGPLTATRSPFPSVLPAGIVEVFGDVPVVQPGTWISIYGANLATETKLWNGDFPTSLSNVSVTINGKKGYLWFVSPNQINVQAPDDTLYGCVAVVVTTPNGQVNSGVQIQPQQPSFSLQSDGKHLVGVIPMTDGTGAYGSGVNSYDLMGPVGAFTYKTRPVKRGESLVLYGVGFGQTNPFVPAGTLFSGSAPNLRLPNVIVGGQYSNSGPFTGTVARVAYTGVVQAGLYQVNITVPTNITPGENQIQAQVNAVNPVNSDNLITRYDTYITVQ